MAVPRFTVKYADGRHVDVRVTPKAQVMFERHFSVSMSKLANEPTAEGSYYLAWAAVHCAGMEGNDFDTFLGLIEDIEPLDTDEVEDEGPTRRVPGSEPSSN